MSFEEANDVNEYFSVFHNSLGCRSKRKAVYLKLPKGEEVQKSSSLRSLESFYMEEKVMAVKRQKKSSQQVVQRSLVSQNAKIFSPSIFYRFAEEAKPSFILDVVTSDVSSQFSTAIPKDFSNGRFLIYTVCQTSISTAPIKMRINSVTVSHWVSDISPIDATDCLVPFGEQNWISIETGSFIIPFSVIGIWANKITIDDILKKIQGQEKFNYVENSNICPITKKPVNNPAKGKNCEHDEVFDLIPFISVCMATGEWKCPICHASIPIEDIITGEAENLFEVKSEEEITFCDETFEF